MKEWMHYTSKGWRDEYSPFDDKDTYYGVCENCGHIMALSGSETGIIGLCTCSPTDFNCNMCGATIIRKDYDWEYGIYNCGMGKAKENKKYRYF